MFFIKKSLTFFFLIKIAYNSKWDEGEEFFEFRNGEGDEMKILFKENECVINGYLKGMEQTRTKEEIIMKLPKLFAPFLHGEPVASSGRKKYKIKLIIIIVVINNLSKKIKKGTSFCFWTNAGKWENCDKEYKETLVQDVLRIFDGKETTYVCSCFFLKCIKSTENYLLDIIIGRKSILNWIKKK